MYKKKTYICGQTIEVEKIYTCHCRSKSIHRSKKINKTTEAVEKQNAQNAFKKYRRLINANFKPADYHVVLHNDEFHKTIDPEVAKKNLQQFLRKLRDILKKEGKELKYVSVTEYGPRSIHHHLLIQNNIEPAVISEAWQNGSTTFIPLKPNGDYTRLASYHMKQVEYNRQMGRGVFAKRWTQSSNLIIPEPIVEIVRADSWRQDPVVPVGYVLVQDSLSVGVSEITGYPYQYYRLAAIPKFKNVKGKRKERDHGGARRKSNKQS